MTDPYSILGIRPDATDEEVKQAYRELARKYHPDRYRDSDLSDLANEKMKEINAAYEQIQKARAAYAGGGSTSRSESNGANDRGQANARFGAIRTLINNNRIGEADRILRGFPAEERNAEWHFLTGCVLYKRGYYVDAQRLFERACEMDPYNQEYQTARDQINRQAAENDPSGYRTAQGSGFDSACTICNTLICADCCCECMGGDLIPCC